MNHIFHYHVTAFLAHHAGFTPEETYTIAQASQYVDRQTIEATVRYGSKRHELLATHHYGLQTNDQAGSVWMPFHFIPGGLERQECEASGDQFVPQFASLWDRFCVSPRSMPAREILVGALRTRNLYRVGIALHAFADTWAHQGFCGKEHEVNRVPGALSLPVLGHAQVEGRPDRYNLVWYDTRRTNPEINNRLRFREAARYVYRYLCTYQGKAFLDEEIVLGQLDGIITVPVQRKEHRDVSSRIQSAVHEGLGKLKGLGSTLGIRTDFSPSELLDPGWLQGMDDEGLAAEFDMLGIVPAFDPYAWHHQALKDTGFLPSQAKDTNSRTYWLKSRIAGLGSMVKKEFEAREGFEDSALYRFNEAAREHLAFARTVISRV